MPNWCDNQVEILAKEETIQWIAKHLNENAGRRSEDPSTSIDFAFVNGDEVWYKLIICVRTAGSSFHDFLTLIQDKFKNIHLKGHYYIELMGGGDYEEGTDDAGNKYSFFTEISANEYEYNDEYLYEFPTEEELELDQERVNALDMWYYITGSTSPKERDRIECDLWDMYHWRRIWWSETNDGNGIPAPSGMGYMYMIDFLGKYIPDYTELPSYEELDYNVYELIEKEEELELPKVEEIYPEEEEFDPIYYDLYYLEDWLGHPHEAWFQHWTKDHLYQELKGHGWSYTKIDLYVLVYYNNYNEEIDLRIDPNDIPLEEELDYNVYELLDKEDEDNIPRQDELDADQINLDEDAHWESWWWREKSDDILEDIRYTYRCHSIWHTYNEQKDIFSIPSPVDGFFYLIHQNGDVFHSEDEGILEYLVILSERDVWNDVEKEEQEDLLAFAHQEYMENDDFYQINTEEAYYKSHDKRTEILTLKSDPNLLWWWNEEQDYIYWIERDLEFVSPEVEQHDVWKDVEQEEQEELEDCCI